MYGLRIFLWSIGLVKLLRPPTASPVILGTGVLWVSTGTHPCGSPSRQDDGETRAPALHTLDDVLRFRGDEEYRAVLLQKSIAMWLERSSWKEIGRKRGYSILDCWISVNVKIARWRKSQRSTGFTTVQNGTQQGGIFRNPSESGSTKGEIVEERVEVAKRYSRGSFQ